MSSRPIKMSWRSIALVLTNILLVAVLIFILLRGTEAGRILHVPAQLVKVPSLHVEMPSVNADFTGLASRAPFYSTRRLYVQPAKSESPPPPAPKYLLGGTVIRPNGPAVAILNNPTSGSVVRVLAGSDLDGWHVETVEASRVVVRYGGQQAEIVGAKRATQSMAAEGMVRAPLSHSNRSPPESGVRVLGRGQAVSRTPTAVPSLPPLAGSGSESVYIPPPPAR